ncbi:hypothetical protein [Anaeromyxobacter oryzae]|uniref:Uncharacterized protein n=1 Tax=Anaeromyxobacter oryzae TaxID=2918170 RepID=A0ABN6MX26_9BACT|nr:hypothetical protein [Anaeromyxobacter oryzae]BDG04278.1 hypothetical protein AMOR_32740 [Anaeromyxobacter oryzae]
MTRRHPRGPLAASQRGSGILLAIVVVLVVSVIAVGIVRYTSRELAGATASKQATALVACAEAGRGLLLSQFRSVGIAPTQLTAMNIPLDADKYTNAVGGHIDSSNVQVEQVTMLPLGTFGSERKNTRDITNIANPALGQLGGKPYRLMVHCSDHGRQLEVEFGVRFGL